MLADDDNVEPGQVRLGMPKAFSDQSLEAVALYRRFGAALGYDQPQTRLILPVGPGQGGETGVRRSARLGEDVVKFARGF